MLAPERSCPRDSCFREIGCFRFNHKSIDVSKLEVDEVNGFNQYCIVIAVDGACSNNGTLYAQASLGIYFGSRYSFNISLALDIDEPTNQKAELMAAIKALQIGKGICSNGRYGKPIVNVTIKSDSEYLGKPVVNGEFFKWLDECILDLNAEGVAVHFWHVERAYNRHADRLAKQAVIP
ncbi:Ribonuclease H-like domain [Trichophyton rubrum]|nr:Ribonuclease H-like domain [Trichophyton rubrum]